ncbi:MAG: chromosome partition protein MukE [Dysgonamonadaceae bacterium]|jgi:chromosome condensin MukBEF MukE localization factor|nr:chromosome partition protein MukE [Dysgonamonadaceae bacterium]
MENANTEYQFLNSDDAIKYFADADIALKQGRHIQNYGNDTQIFYFIDEYFDKGLEEYYAIFWLMKLTKDSNDNERFYYLEPPEGSRAKFGNRFKELEGEKIIFAILLLNLEKEKYFEEKEFSWQELEQIFKESENKTLWKKLLFGKDKENYTPTEEQNVKKKVRQILSDFEKLGWIVMKSEDEMQFDILPSIARIGRLYADVINNIETIEEFLSNE